MSPRTFFFRGAPKLIWLQFNINNRISLQEHLQIYKTSDLNKSEMQFIFPFVDDIIARCYYCYKFQFQIMVELYKFYETQKYPLHSFHAFPPGGCFNEPFCNKVCKYKDQCMVQQMKLLFIVPASHLSISLSSGCSTFSSFPCKHSWESSEDSQVLRQTATHVRNPD